MQSPIPQAFALVKRGLNLIGAGLFAVPGYVDEWFSLRRVSRLAHSHGQAIVGEDAAGIGDLLPAFKGC